MARRKKRVSFSLFPFLSVLINIIGILIFMCLALSITAIDPPLIVESAVESISGTGDMRTPVVVECKDSTAFIIKNASGKAVRDQEFNVTDTWDHIVKIYRNGTQDNPDSWNDNSFLEFLNKLSGEGSRFLLFLVRPSGIYPYTILSDIVKMRNNIKPENKILETDSFDDECNNWEIDWTLLYQEENRKVIPPA